MAIAWSGKTPQAGNLEVLQRLLEREQHHLKSARAAGLPISVLQQLHHCAVSMGRDELALADGALKASRSRGVPALMTYAAYPLGNPAAIRVLEGHRSPVNCVVLTADGRRAVSGSNDGRMVVWDVEAGNALASLEKHSARVNAVCLTADGNYLLSASDDGTLILWDLRTGRPVQSLIGHSKGVTTASLSSDGRRALSGSSDCTLKLWDVDKAEVIRTFQDCSPDPTASSISTGYSRQIIAVDMSPDARRGLSAARLESNWFILWDLETGDMLSKFAGYAPCRFSPDGRYVVCESASRASFYAVEAGDLAAAWTFGLRSRMIAVAFSPDSRLLLAALEDRRLVLLDVESRRLLSEYWGHTSSVTGVAISADCSRAVTSAGDKTLIVWDLSSRLPPREYEPPLEEIYHANVGSSGTVALTSGLKHLNVWDMDSGRRTKSLEHPGEIRPAGQVQDIGLSADGLRGFSVSGNGMVLWDLATGQPLRSFDPAEQAHNAVDAISLAADARQVLLGYRGFPNASDVSAILRDLDTGEVLFRHTRTTFGRVPKRSLHIQSGLVVEATDGEKLALMDVRTGQAVCTFGPPWRDGLVCLTPDGRRALIEAEDRGLLFVDTVRDEVVFTLRCQQERIWALALAEDGRRAISGGADGTLVLWDLETGNAASRVYLNGPVYALAMAGDCVLAAEQGGSVRFLRLVAP